MQDRYAFDVGDFGKLGLLRHLAPALGDLGVIWYATSIATAANDGRHTAYLELGRPQVSAATSTDYRRCDVHLFDSFRAAMGGTAPVRSIARLETQPIWPVRTAFVSEPTPGGADRPAWFRRALAAVAEASWVFCDPDNGIARTGSSLERRGSPKHILLEEVRELYARRKSLVVYHHLTRAKGGHLQEIVTWAASLSEATGCKGARAVHFRRGSARAFFLLSQPDASQGVDEALAAIDASPWRQQGHLAVRGGPLT